ncbi:tetratricopeptide repeat protein [Kribbella sp. NPDC056345]|uniref:tetratricopeptide repeat protein n=1 Tax=Kribbella sp. NPDC056345 TaxID=3345789 RepID=UPI0035E0341E
MQDGPAEDGSQVDSHNEITGDIHGVALQVGANHGQIVVSGETTAAYLRDSNVWPAAKDWNALAAGIHPARAEDASEAITPYVTRDIDQQLRIDLSSAAERGGLILLVGQSASGKSRTAFEALRAELPEHRVATPAGRPDLAAVLNAVRKTPLPCVLWLDELDVFLGPGGLDHNVLRAYASLRIPILGTMRMQRFLTYSGNRRRADGDPLLRQMAMIEERVLNMARVLEVSSRWTETELHRAEEQNDPRVRDALAHHETYGIAEYIAAGPALWNEWRRSSDVGGHPRGAALIAAAVDLARTGLPGPFPEDLVLGLHERYLEAHGGALLRPEPVPEAIEWATRSRYRAVSPLMPVRTGFWRVFDYLVDRSEEAIPSQRVPAATWAVAAAEATGTQRFDVALKAAESGTAAAQEFAESIWLEALEVSNNAYEAVIAYNLGVLYLDIGRAGRAIPLFERAAEAGEPRAAFNLSVLYRQNDDKEAAQRWSRLAAELGYPPAFFQVGFDIEERGDIEEAERWYRRGAEAGEYRSATQLGTILSERGHEGEAQLLYHQAEAAGDLVATYNIGLFHHLAERLDLAEARYAKVAGSVPEAALNLGTIREAAGDVRQAKHWYEHAADAGLPAGAYNLGILLEKAGDTAGAEEWLARAAESGHIPAVHVLAKILYQSGRLSEAIPLLMKASSLGDALATGVLGEVLVDVDRIDEAIHYLTVAAEQGNRDAAYNLAVAYERLDDLPSAKSWFRDAADKGDKESALCLADLLFRSGEVASAAWWIRRGRRMPTSSVSSESDIAVDVAGLDDLAAD